MSVAARTQIPFRSVQPVPQHPAFKKGFKQHRSASPISISPKRPIWVSMLLKLRKFSTPIMVLLLLGSLPIYGWSVYIQQSWGKTYRELKQLRREEQELITRNEQHKYDLAQQAEQHSAGLVPQGPNNTLFLKPAPSQSQPHSVGQKIEPPAAKGLPIGY